MKNMKYVIYKEGNYYVSQCLNVDVASFGSSIQEAIDNLREAVELYFEDSSPQENYLPVSGILVGELAVNV